MSRFHGRKINVFVNGAYAYNTNSYPRCKDAVSTLRKAGEVRVASVPNDYVIHVTPTDKIAAFYDKR